MKLSLVPADAERLRRHPILRALRQRRAATRRLLITYYDTQDFNLLQNAVALRVHKVGRKCVQTVEHEAVNGVNPVVRSERQQGIEGDRPDLARLDDPALRQLLETQNGTADLRPVFVTEVTRRVWPITFGASEILCALDVGEIKADGRTEPLCEVDFELKSGAAAGVFELARALNKTVPLRLEPTSKAMRGYGMVTGRAPAPRRAAPVALRPGMSVRASLATIGRACIDHVVANLPSAYRGEDAEGVHQLRVGIRRLRAAFSVFRPAVPESDREALGIELRWLQQEVGPAREWDVLIDGTLRDMAAWVPGREALDPLVAVAEARRAEAYERTRAALASPRCTDLMLRLESWIDSQLWGTPRGAHPAEMADDLLDRPVESFAAKILRARHAKTEKLGRQLRQLDGPELHDLRIRVKKLRYAADFFRDLYAGKAAKRYLGTLKSLQEVMGTAHDAATAAGLIADLERAAGPEAGRAVALVHGWTAARHKVDRERVLRLWEKFADLKSFWKGG